MKNLLRFVISSLFLSTLILGSNFSIARADSQAPLISYISPTSANVGNTIYVYGSNFDQTTFVAWDGTYGQAITPTLISATSLSFIVPSNTSMGSSHTIQVGQKASSLPLSNSVSLNVIIAQQPPIISYINPSSVVIGNTVYIYGLNFSQATFVALDGSSGTTVTPTFISPTSLSFVVPSYLGIGFHTVQVNEKASNFPLGSSVSLMVIAAQQAPTVSDAQQTIQLLLDKIKVLQNQIQSQQVGSMPPLKSFMPANTSPTQSDTGSAVSSCVELSNNLTYRSRDVLTNGDVSALQDFLQAKGYLNSEPTGFFGLVTLGAVKKFQSDNAISPTGYVGTITSGKIKDLSCQ